MEGTYFFRMDPDAGREEEITRGAEAITVTRAGGQAVALDPLSTRITVTDEHAPLAQMGEDWGAVCEVFRQAVNTFARVAGFNPQAGDEIVLRYPGRAAEMVLRVVEMEGGRARIQLSTR